MSHTLSPDDVRFRDDFEAGRITPAMFDHRSHIRLAYVYLAGRDTETALPMVRESLRRFLQHHGIPAGKYHETLTRAWVLAVRHFMEKTPAASSADEFIELNPVMLDSQIMLTHYSAGLLFSAEARAAFVEPDLDPIPRYQA
jgi:hypothetical protein